MISRYSQACPVIFGVGAINQIEDEARKMGATKVLLVYDGGVKASGVSEKITKILDAAGIDIEIYEGVTPEPTLSQIDTAAERVRSLKIDTVIGIGGGSSLDTAKALSVLNENKGPVKKYVQEFGGSFGKASPLILVPTASGTGAEVTALGVLIDEESHGKVVVFRGGDLAIVDPELTLTVPPHITASTGMDALAQAIEAYTSNGHDPRSDVLALKAVNLIIRNLEIAVKDGSDLNARIDMSLGSNLAGIAFADASVHFGHAISHEFGNALKMPHGIGCALALPVVLEVGLEAEPERGLDLLNALEVPYTKKETGKDLGLLASGRIKELMRTIGIRSLKEQGISREAAVDCAAAAHEKNWFIIKSPVDIDVPFLGKLIGRVYDGYQ